MSIAVNLGRVVIMRQVADWLAKHPTLPISYVAVQEDGLVTVHPSSKHPGEHHSDKAEIHNLYTIAEAVGVEVGITAREYGSGWYLTASWRIGQVPVESQITIWRMAAEVREPEQAKLVNEREPATANA